MILGELAMDYMILIMNDMIKRYGLILLFAIASVLSSCANIEPPDVSDRYNRVVLIYMAGNTTDGIGYELLGNLKDMESGYIPPVDGQNVLVAYVHTRGTNPLLIRFSKDRNFAVVKDTLYKYEAQVSTDPDVLRAVLEKTKEEFSAYEYGLIMSSHGTGWLSGNFRSRSAGTYSVDPYAHLVRAYGADIDGTGSTKMELKDLRNAIPYKLSFLMFDCCFMGGIEVAYELREKTDYLIASPAEIYIKGFPFDKIMRPFFETTLDMKRVCEEYYDYYSNSSSGGTISLVRSDKLEALANVCSTIFENHRAKIRLVNRGSIQRYYRTAGGTPYFWDLEHFIETIATPSEYANFKTAMAEAVPIKFATNYFYDLSIVRYSGLSTYIPTASVESVETMYKGLDWNIASGMIK